MLHNSNIINQIITRIIKWYKNKFELKKKPRMKSTKKLTTSSKLASRNKENNHEIIIFDGKIANNTIYNTNKTLIID